MKYIVYKTTNIINNYIYIGVHKTETPYDFDNYLGNGVYTNRPNTYKKSKTCFQQAVNQYGIKNFKRETLAVFDTPEEAYFLEGMIVNEEFLSRSDIYNMILGGIINMVSGKRVYMYSAKTGNFIQEFDSLANAALYVHSNSSTIHHSITLKFKIKEFVFLFDKQEHVNLEEYNFKILQPVYRYLKTGEFDKEFNSLNDAGKQTLHTSAIYIQKAMKCGYLVKDTYYFSDIKAETFDKARSIQIKNRTVYQYNSEGEYLTEYATQDQAEKLNPYCNITNSIKFKTKDQNNNYWSLEKLNTFNKQSSRKAKKVGQFDNNGILLKTWNSATACAKEMGPAVKNVLLNKYSKHKGYIYKYINN